METKVFVDNVFSAVDRMDMDTFLSYLDSEVMFRFGNGPAVNGIEPQVKEAVSGFFGSIRALSHTIEQMWEQGDHLICKGTATYTRKDEKKVSVPFATIFGLKDGKIASYEIYVDLAPLFA